MPDLILGKEIMNDHYPEQKVHRIVASDDYEYRDELNNNFQQKEQKWWIGLTDEEMQGLKTFLKRAGKINVDDKKAIVLADNIQEKISTVS